ncbi:LamG-like jellyroll fold domain-containing protein [Streptomyces sp. NBC_01451]|uniref:LamG-like jellyroll fold domain-containing protein n=1 Tax=Streptomyces sp. NBC_01451 TaxID=2903872 RepID=UPI002E35A02F|nr:LamG-like jellyroll fold domain-containing protein [Streptomyces sp. NBC_01451]
MTISRARRRVRARAVALVLTPALMVGALSGATVSEAATTASEAASESASSTSSGTPSETASELARETGEPVEVTAERDVYERVFAQPEGGFRSELSAGPRWAPQPDGSWKDIDTDLEFKPDGSVGPRTALIDVEFSGGGTDPLVAVEDSGRSAALSWPAPLPTPVLLGDTAEYRSVLPGVDLRMTAGAEGFRQILVVRTEAAADDPELAEIELAQHTDGLRIEENAAGGMSVVDAVTGDSVFSGGTPLMWDSGSEAGANASADPVKDALREDPAAAPMPGDSHARVDLDIDADSVTLTPDPAFLDAVDASSLPLYIDPPLAVTKPDKSASRSFYTWANSAFPSTEYANFDDDKGIGRCLGGGCGSPYTGRMYFEYNLDGWENRKIYDATFHVYETWAYNCTPSWVNLYLVDAAKLSKATNWNNKPSDDNLMGDRKVAYGNEEHGCENGDVAFNDNPDETNENLTATVRSKAGTGSAIAFSLRAADEDAAGGWKRFKGDSGTLQIFYNTVPGKPASERTTSPTTSCVTGAGRPFIRDDTPVLTVNVTDPDPHNVRALYRVWDMLPNANDVQVYGDLWTAYKADGVMEKAIPAGNLKHGHTYHWHAQATDGIDDSAWSDWCEFSYDNTRPSTRPKVTLETAGDILSGTTPTFSFAPNGSVDPAYGNDVDRYVYGLNTDTLAASADPAARGAAATGVGVAVPKFGLNVLSVASVDDAGNVGPVEDYVFQSGRACDDPPAEQCAVASYRLDETSGTTGADSASGASGDKDPLTVTGGTWVAGSNSAVATDRAIRFDGVAGGFGTATSLVDTRQGFTVMARAKVSDVSENRAVISQTGANGNGFALYWSTTLGWVFGRHRDATTGTDAARAKASAPGASPVGKWVHLAGVFDPSQNSVTLYVNGVEQGTDQVIPSNSDGTTYDPTRVWHADGGFQVGRARWSGAFANPFKGDIDDIRVYPTVLGARDIDKAANTD